MINVPVHPQSYRAYASAARLVARRAGGPPPTAVILIQHELSHRDARSIAFEYLDFRRQQNRTKRSRERGPARPRSPLDTP